MVVLDRTTRAPRHFMNLPAMNEIMLNYGFEAERVEVDGEMTFQEQVRFGA